MAVLMHPAPYKFDGAYSQCYSHRPTAMDERHAYIVHEILKSWDFVHALELGSFRGASSTAFVEAINVSRVPFRVTLCDTHPSASLLGVVNNCRHPDSVRITASLSWAVLANRHLIYDFVLVDACHDIASVTKELQYLVERKPLCVMAHDPNATAAGYPLAEGAELLKKTFESMNEYGCMEDRETREGEETHRGLFLATSNHQLFDIAGRVFQKWRD